MGMRAGQVVFGMVAALSSTPALPCTYQQPPIGIHRVLLPEQAEVPPNVALLAMPVGSPTRARVERDGEVVMTLESETGDIRLPRLEPLRDYRVVFDRAGNAQRNFRTTDVDDTEAPPAPTVSVEVTEGSAKLDFASTCDSGDLPVVWRETRSEARIEVELTGDAIAAVRVDDDGQPIDLNRPFVFRPASSADGVRFAVMDAAGHLSEATTVSVTDPDGCAQTSSTSTASLAIGVALLARARSRRRS